MTSRFSHGPSGAQLGQAIEDNLAALFRAMAASLQGDLLQSESLCLQHSFPSDPMFKGAFATAVAQDEVDSAIDRTIAWFQTRQAPFFFWWVGPSSQPADLGARLQARGLQSMDANGAPGMVMDLNYVDESALDRTPAGFAIAEASSEADLQAFKRVFVESYGAPESAAQAWVDATLHAGIAQAPWRIYVGRLDQRPVAINILFVGGGVASVYAIGTSPEVRKRGIGAAITLLPLMHAREQGFRHAVLYATQMGVRVYERLGFQVIPARICRYLWRAS